MQAFDFVCACLAPSTAALPNDLEVDAKLLARVARRHQVSALVAARLEQVGNAVPNVLKQQANFARKRALKQLGLALDLVEALEGSNVETLLIKGVALSQQAFGSPLLRGAVDIDLLVRPQDVQAAWAVLAQEGLRQVMPSAPLEGARLALFCWASKDSVHQHPVSGQLVELHWRLSDETAHQTTPPQEGQNSITLVPGRTVRVLGDRTLFLYLCNHGAAHGWARLKWLADVAALLHRSPDGGSALLAHAERKGGQIAAASAVVLAEEMFGLAPPTGFAVPRGLRMGLLLWLARKTMQAGEGARELEATPWRGWVEMLAKMLVAADWRQRLAVLRRLALSGEDVAKVPLPKGLIWLYPVLRVPLLINRRMGRLQRLRGAN